MILGIFWMSISSFSFFLSLIAVFMSCVVRFCLQFSFGSVFP